MNLDVFDAFKYILADNSSAVFASAVKLTYIYSLYNTSDIACKQSSPSQACQPTYLCL